MPSLTDRKPAGGDGVTRPLQSRLRRLDASRAKAVGWRTLTLLTCPCCIPLWVAVLSGTAAGALLTRNLYVTIAIFLALFLFCAWKALRSYDRK